MSYIRADGYKLKDPEDDAAYQVLMGDVQRLALNFARGSVNSAYQLTPAAAEAISESSGVPAVTLPDSGLFCFAQGIPTGTYSGFPNPTLYGNGIQAAELDPYLMYNAATGVITFPSTGYVRVRASTSHVSTNGPGGLVALGIALNGVSQGFAFVYSNGSGGAYSACLASEMFLSVNAGDTVFSFMSDGGTVSPTYGGGSSLSAVYL